MGYFENGVLVTLGFFLAALKKILEFFWPHSKIFGATLRKKFLSFSKTSEILPKILKILKFFSYPKKIYGLPPEKFSDFFQFLKLGILGARETSDVWNSPLGFSGGLPLPAAEPKVY